MKRPTLWLLLLSLIWPTVQVLFFYLRFQRLPANVAEALYFLPMGILSGAFVLFLMNRAENHTTRVSTAVGYLVACPFALIGALAGGLALHPLIGVTLFGALPLILGSAAGYGLGKVTTNS
jgi:branched-subunit amino acid transport protein